MKESRYVPLPRAQQANVPGFLLHIIWMVLSVKQEGCEHLFFSVWNDSDVLAPASTHSSRLVLKKKVA